MLFSGGGGGALLYSKVRYVRLLKPPFLAHSSLNCPLKLCFVTLRPHFFKSFLPKITSLSPKDTIFWNFWSKMTNLFKKIRFVFHKFPSKFIKKIFFWKFLSQKDPFCVEFYFSLKDPSFLFFCKFCLIKYPFNWKSGPITSIFFIW